MLMMFHRVTLYITRAAILWLACYLLLQRKHNPSDRSSLKAHDDRGIDYAHPSIQRDGSRYQIGRFFRKIPNGL